jgi:transposase
VQGLFFRRDQSTEDIPVIFVNTLSAADRQALFHQTQTAVGRVAKRAWMVLWSAQQVSVPDIALRLQCQPKTVRQWLRRFQQTGFNGLRDHPRGGRPTRRSPGLRQAVLTQVNQPPWTFGYLFAIWTVQTLSEHLVTRCRQSVSPWLTRQLLRQHRYRFRRPKIAPRGIDPQREAIHQSIGRKIAQAASNTAILVQDETDIRLFPVLRQMWMKQGAQVTLPAPLTNQKRTIFGTLDIHTGEVFYRCFPRQRSAEMILFLTALCAQYEARPILLLVDRATIHQSKELRDWLAGQSQLELVWLPKYGGHRDNPIEKLWWHLKGYAAANRCCRSMDELITLVTRYLDSITPARVFQLVA